MSSKKTRKNTKSNTQGGQTKKRLQKAYAQQYVQQPLVKAPAAQAKGTRASAPQITMGKGSMRVKHRELLSSVTGSVLFTIFQSISLNPGLAASFPWLSSVANSWEEYVFHSLRFEYLTRTGSNTPGSMMIIPEYDASDSAPSSELIASTYDGCVEDAPWKDIKCIMTKKNLQGSAARHFTRNGPLAANQDIKLYDVGSLFLATVDGTAVGWGKIWVEYDIEFFLPQTPPAGAVPYGGQVVGGGTQSGANPLGSVPVPDAQNVGFTTSTASVVTFKAVGDYVISAYFVGTVITAIQSMAAGKGASLTVLTDASAFTAAATSGCISAAVRVNDLVAPTLAFALTATTVTSAVLNIGQAPPLSLN